MIKKYFLKISFVLVLLFANYANAGVIRLNKIIAIVNGDVITQSEVEKRMAMINHISGTTLQDSALRKQALDSLIDSLLQMQLAKRMNMQINEAEVDNAITNIAKHNQITIDQLKQSLQEREGLSFKAYKEQIREQMLISRLQQYFLGRDITINAQDVAKAMRNLPKINGAAASYHVADILFEIPDNASSEQTKTVENMAVQMATKLKLGVSLDKLIQEHNASGQHITNNDLGWRKLDEFPSLFAPKIAKMSIGQIIGPLKAPNGLHLIKLLDTQNIQSQNATLTKTQAQDFVFHQKLQEKLKPWLKELRDTAYIKIY